MVGTTSGGGKMSLSHSSSIQKLHITINEISLCYIISPLQASENQN